MVVPQPLTIEQLLLTKSEIPLIGEVGFQVPIHPRLLNPNVLIDPDIARRVFAQAAEEWYSDLTKYVDCLEKPEIRAGIQGAYLKRKPRIIWEHGWQYLDTTHWRDHVLTSQNGFAKFLNISRDAGGTLFFNDSDDQCESHVLYSSSEGFIQFSSEKAKAFAVRPYKNSQGQESVQLYVYAGHNIERYQGALFLRNWALLYLNEAMKGVFK